MERYLSGSRLFFYFLNLNFKTFKKLTFCNISDFVLYGCDKLKKYKNFSKKSGVFMLVTQKN